MLDAQSINKIPFTVKETEIIACIVNGCKTKKIAFILDISIRTVTTHIQNIFHKTLFHSQEEIKCFVNKSDAVLRLNKIYEDLVLQHHLKKLILKFSQQTADNNQIICGFVDCVFYKDIFEYIKKYLIIAKIDIKEISDLKTYETRLKILEQKDIILFQQNTNFANTIFLCTDQKFKNYINQYRQIKIIDYVDKHESIIKLLSILLPEIDFAKVKSELKELCKREISDKYTNISIFMLLKLLTFKNIIKFLIITFLSSILFWKFVMQNTQAIESQSIITNTIEPVSYFVNHVTQLVDLNTDLEKLKKVSIVGTSGIGKTQLARMYAYKNRDQYNIIWFFDCNIDLNSQFVKLAKAINKKEKTNLLKEDEIVSKKEVMDYLAPLGKWLLIFDNLKIKQSHWMQEVIEWEHNGHVIFAAQDSDNFPNIMQVKVFNQEDGAKLAKQLLKESDPKAIEFLTEECKGYPISIVQGAQTLNQIKGLEFDQYREKIHKSNDKIKFNLQLAQSQLPLKTKTLLNKISLINNQSFSKNLLKIISDNQGSIDDDIYQLTKLALISNVDPDKTNPVFEMHDVIAQKLISIRNLDENRALIEEIITNLLVAMPRDFIKLHLFRDSKTISENLKILSRYAKEYDINLVKAMELNRYLLGLFHFDYSGADEIVHWFEELDQNNKFQPELMDNDAKARYAAFLRTVGRYYIMKLKNPPKAAKYNDRAIAVYDQVQGYESFKIDAIYQSILNNLRVGDTKEIAMNIQGIEQIKNSSSINKNDAEFIYFASKAELFYLESKYHDAMEENEKSIQAALNSGIDANNSMLTNRYL